MEGQPKTESKESSASETIDSLAGELYIALEECQASKRKGGLAAAEFEAIEKRLEVALDLLHELEKNLKPSETES